MRVIIRAFVMRKPGMDDYTIVAAVCLTLGYTIEILLEKHHRIGFPASTLTTAQMQSQLKVTLSIQVTYPLVVGFIKTSIVYLYLRFGKWRFILSKSCCHFQVLRAWTDFSFCCCSHIRRLSSPVLRNHHLYRHLHHHVCLRHGRAVHSR